MRVLERMLETTQAQLPWQILDQSLPIYWDNKDNNPRIKRS
jgi:hypothetical protein